MKKQVQAKSLSCVSIFCVIILVAQILLFFFTPVDGLIPSDEYTVNTKYEYPFQSGTTEWFSFEDSKELTRLLNIPNNILSEMSTSALVESVLDYPKIADIGAFGPVSNGIRAVSFKFNGLSELIERSDAEAAIMRKLKFRLVFPSFDSSTQIMDYDTLVALLKYI